MLRIGLMGCGRIAERHAELLGNNLIQGASLAAVCDLQKSKAETLGEKFKVPYYEDIDQMMDSVDLDLVSVLTESGNHAKHVIHLSKYKKHIVVEKPMALRLSDADEMIKACDEANIKLFVVKQNRFNVPILHLRHALEKGKFGKLVLGTVRVRWCRRQEYYDQAPWRGTWALDGGVLTNQASHHVDLLQWMMGEPESVSAYSSSALANIEVEDTAVVILKFANGALGIIEATTATRPRDIEGSISIMGENGIVEIGGFAVNEMKIWKFNDLDYEQEKNVISSFSVNPPNVYGFGHKSYYEHVVKCISNAGSNLVDGFEGKKSLRLIHAIYESIETGKEVFIKSSRKNRLGYK